MVLVLLHTDEVTHILRGFTDPVSLPHAQSRRVKKPRKARFDITFDENYVVIHLALETFVLSIACTEFSWNTWRMLEECHVPWLGAGHCWLRPCGCPCHGWHDHLDWRCDGTDMQAAACLEWIALGACENRPPGMLVDHIRSSFVSMVLKF